MELNEFFRDEKKVQEGTWVNEISGLDPEVSFLVRGLTSRDYMNAFARRQRQAPAKDREPDRSLKLDAVRRIMADLLPEYIILDWKGITQGGKELPFNKEQLKEWLLQPSALPLLNAITEAAGRVDDIVKTETANAVKN